MSARALASRVTPLSWDSEHFGVAVGRVEAGVEDLAAALAEADAAGLRLLIARAEASDLAAIQSLERSGFRLADTLVRYARALPAPTSAISPVVRPARPADAPAVEAVAAEAFDGYPGHFRNDTRLDPRLADRVYVRWARSACEAARPETGLVVAEEGGRIVGFGLVEDAGEETAEGALYAVARAARGRGVGAALLAATMRWAAGFRRMTVYSSLANPPAHRVWLAAGFVPAGGLHTLHRWAEDAR
jgi:GNAT superfamily N-acetyltransferase